MNVKMAFCAVLGYCEINKLEGYYILYSVLHEGARVAWGGKGVVSYWGSRTIKRSNIRD